MKSNYGDYDYVSKEVIRKLIRGDYKAFGIVTRRYSNYLHRCFVGLASKYKIKLCELSLDDLKQEAWIRFRNIVQLRFQL